MIIDRYVGVKSGISVTIHIAPPLSVGEAIEVEGFLRDKGIEAFNGSPGRVNIRVEQPVKQ